MTGINSRLIALAGITALSLAALFLVSCSEPAEEQAAADSRNSSTASESPAGLVVSTDEPSAESILPETSDVVAAASDGAEAALPRLIDLGADKCVPCKMMAPILEELRETYEGEFDVVFIDVWKDRSVGEQYGVRVIPTQIFFAPDGSELFRHQGFLSREDIMSKWSELGYAFGETVGGE